MRHGDGLHSEMRHPEAANWGMLARGFLCQNIVTGCAYGGFGIAMLPLQRQYEAGAGAATLALSITMLTLGIVGPAVGTMIGRLGLRPMMLVGALLLVVGYGMLAFAPSMTTVIAIYALPLGIGMAMCGTIPVSVLASNWFEPSAGRAVGLVNMPVLVVLMPLLGFGVLERFGLRGLFLMLAACSALLIPLAVGIRDRPDGADLERDGVPALGDPMLPSAVLLRAPAFWMIVVGGGALSAVGITGVSHIAALATERGVPAGEAALLLSVMGGASVIGSVLTGTLCDRIGAACTLAVASLALCLSWALLLVTAMLPPMIVSVLITGICGGGVFPCINVLAGDIYGTPTLPRALGLFSLLALPFSFLAPPLAGVLHDWSGSYQPVVMIIIIACAAVGIGFFAMTRTTRRHTDRKEDTLPGLALSEQPERRFCKRTSGGASAGGSAG